MATLGCPASYHAVIHWRCGAYVFLPVENLTAVQLNRVLNDTSEAEITITKDSLDDNCCGHLGSVRPWLHELSIYRDDDLVWQGPIMKKTESRNEVTIEAFDITAWLARIVNFSTKKFKNKEADVSSIALYYIRQNLLDSKYACTHYETIDGKRTKVDHACITPFISRKNVGAKPAYKPQADAKYNLEILEELVKSGLYWTTVGRRLLLRGKPNKAELPIATLTTDDLMGDYEVITSGEAFATRIVATNSSSEEDRQTVTVGRSCKNPFGRVDYLVPTTDVPKCECGTSDPTCKDECEDSSSSKACKDCIKKCEADCAAEQREALLEICKAEAKGRYPVPVAISIGNGAALHPETPVAFSQLVCGYKIDVRLDRACQKIQQSFILSEMSVDWDTGAGETVSVGLTPVDEPGVDEDQRARARTSAQVAAGNPAAVAWERDGTVPAPPAAAVALAERATT